MSHDPPTAGHMTHLKVPLAGFSCHMVGPRLLMTHSGELLLGGEGTGGGGIHTNTLVLVVAWGHGRGKGGRRAEGRHLKLRGGFHRSYSPG